MESKFLKFIKKYKYLLIVLLMLSSLLGTVTLFAQKQDTKLPENPISKEAVSSTVLLAGSDKDVSKALKDSGVKFKKKQEADKQDEQELAKDNSKEVSQKHIDNDELDPGIDKNITPSKLKKKENKSDRTYFTTTIKDGEQVTTEAYKFKIIQKEADLKIEKQQVLVNEQEVDFSGTVILASGENKIEVVMTYSNKKGQTFKVAKNYTVYFNSQIEIKTSLKDNETVEKELFKFEAYAIRNKKEEAISVYLNGKKVESVKDFAYEITLEAGENLIELKAGSDKDTLEESYIINYKKQEDSDHEKESGPPTISVDTLQDGMIVENEKLTFNVTAKTHSGKPLDSFQVYLNDEEIGEEWKKTGEAQYTTHLVESVNTIKIIAVDKEEKSEISYKINFKNKSDGKATFTVQASTVGFPEVIPATEVELEKGVPASEYLIKLLTDYGYSFDHTGKTDKSFYLATIFSNSGDFFNGGSPMIPGDLKTKLFERKLLRDTEDIRNDIYDEVYLPENHNGLGEFDFTSGSGWMYSVNGVYPNVGFSDYYLKDGDSVRLRFTLMLGEDIGGGFNGN
ncbi:DUF4430 domain-containing protein [Vagococcus carniphilus]|uniref:DUF4430 domain-containing protein n=1 Tax=Vagococcus carniphilus TaxID=218144 RepID=A0AAW8UA77_9ENTE|nr:DUF4430 domain-containing protein [Vagococcus carniphilus]MDT2829709.1 DUF4430 domain-containing protein [Vagococcus carniphilus]MDT2834182.1 DUF4430 domain-containing protein [Vagococcus carniphilus]MDT2853226.1 DUF4430 domain-containing protein [Vagococcus carniphilus]